MAKLSARNRTCAAEVTREYDAATLQASTDKVMREADPNYVEGSRRALCIWSRTTRRLMSDRTVLEKRDVRYQPDALNPEGRRHSYGWKVRGKLKDHLTPDDFPRIYREIGWTVHVGDPGTPAVVLDVERVARAVRRDDMTGFCTACGHSQGGVEGDAEGIRCQSCGQPAVKGAENLLLELS